MSYYDDASLMFLAGGGAQKDGKAYSVKPIPVYGAELVINGDFATNLSGWNNKSSTSTWVSGSARVDNSIGNASSGIFQDIGLVLGKTYTLTATLKLLSADSNGNFVVLTSNSGGGSQTFEYSLSKHLNEFIPSYFKKIADKNIFYNTVKIGLTNTKIHKKILNRNLIERTKLLPTKKMAKPKDIANYIFYI